jgi:hypothetical protein
MLLSTMAVNASCFQYLEDRNPLFSFHNIFTGPQTIVIAAKPPELAISTRLLSILSTFLRKYQLIFFVAAIRGSRTMHFGALPWT